MSGWSALLALIVRLAASLFDRWLANRSARAAGRAAAERDAIREAERQEAAARAAAEAAARSPPGQDDGFRRD